MDERHRRRIRLLSPSGFRIYQAITSLMADTSLSSMGISLKTLAGETSLSYPTILKATHEIEKLGLLGIKRQKSLGLPTIYKLPLHQPVIAIQNHLNPHNITTSDEMSSDQIETAYQHWRRYMTVDQAKAMFAAGVRDQPQMATYFREKVYRK